MKPKKRKHVVGKTNMKIGKNTVRGKDGKPLVISDLESAQQYEQEFFGGEVAEGGTKKYLTLHGPASPDYVSVDLMSQGLAKMAIAGIAVLCSRAAEGDKEASGLLDVIKEYQRHQPQRAAEALIQHSLEVIKTHAPDARLVGAKVAV